MESQNTEEEKKRQKENRKQNKNDEGFEKSKEIERKIPEKNRKQTSRSPAAKSGVNKGVIKPRGEDIGSSDGKKDEKSGSPIVSAPTKPIIDTSAGDSRFVYAISVELGCERWEKLPHDVSAEGLGFLGGGGFGGSWRLGGWRFGHLFCVVAGGMLACCQGDFVEFGAESRGKSVRSPTSYE